MYRLVALLLVALGCTAPPVVNAQPAPATADDGPTSPPRHRITLGVGLLPQVETSPGSAQASGFLGSLAYANRVALRWEAEVAAALHSVDATAGDAATVSSLLIGANYYPAVFARSATVFPYLTGALGPYVGTTASGFAASTRTETVVGARIGGGVDVRLARWLHGGLRAAYHIAPDYAEAVGGITSPRGAQLSLELSIVLGRR